MTEPTPTIARDAVLARLAALKTATTPALKQEWRALFGAEPPPYNRRFLESRLAYRVQELAFGGLKPETVARLEALGEQFSGGKVTQAFNTTTSMGRLTLNILLSFAQFEREVIGERIRDKFAASRRRGIWMGGWAPLGFDIRDRKLVVNEVEAVLVRRIFTGFVEMESGTKLVQALRAEGMTTKRGSQLTKNDLYRTLSNRVYLGEAVHKGTPHPGEHDAIVSREAWDAVHAVLRVSPRIRRNHSAGQTPSLLRGLVFGADGRAMSPSHTRGKRGQIYRYYVSQAVLKGGASDGPVIARFPAGELEALVLAQVRALLRQPEVVVGIWLSAGGTNREITEAEVVAVLEHFAPMWDELFPAEQARIVRLLVDRVDIGEDGADVRLRMDGLTGLVREIQARPEVGQRAA